MNSYALKILILLIAVAIGHSFVGFYVIYQYVAILVILILVTHWGIKWRRTNHAIKN